MVGHDEDLDTPGYELTEKRKLLATPLLRLVKPMRACNPRDVPLKTMTTWELFFVLMNRGFIVVVTSLRTFADFDAAKPDTKIVVLQRGKKTFLWEYLFALAKPCSIVPHMKKKEVYDMLLYGKSQAEANKTARRSGPRVKVDRSASEDVARESSAEASAESGESSSKAGESSGQEVDGGGEAGESSGGSDEAGESSGEAGESSDEAGESSGEAGESSGEAGGEPSAEDRMRAVFVGSACGLNRISPIFNDQREEIGYEFHCKHPWHQRPRVCVKTIQAVRGRTMLDCYRILVEWAHRGRDVDDRPTHFYVTWEEVLTDFEEGRLQANPPEVTEWPERYMVGIGGGAKRRRTV